MDIKHIVSAPIAAVTTGSGKTAHLWHAVELNSDGDVIRVLCNRVKLDHILDDATQHNVKPVNCPVCAARISKESR